VVAGAEGAEGRSRCGGLDRKSRATWPVVRTLARLAGIGAAVCGHVGRLTLTLALMTNIVLLQASGRCRTGSSILPRSVSYIERRLPNVAGVVTSCSDAPA